ncbi:MAG: hypothetical protein BYD32DRAFT_429858 [Podila humilis]|nr:MAG: hypothetical protein BYD32DRAFT_429858 [Podila humilis]
MFAEVYSRYCSWFFFLVPAVESTTGGIALPFKDAIRVLISQTAGATVPVTVRDLTTILGSGAVTAVAPDGEIDGLGHSHKDSQGGDEDKADGQEVGVGHCL